MEQFTNIAQRDADSQPELQKADIGTRIGAFMIDHFFLTMVLLVPFYLFVFQHFRDNPFKIFSLFPAFMLVASFVCCSKDIVKGASLGKRILGLAVRKSSDPAEIPSPLKLFLRNIFIFMWPVEFLVLVCSAKRLGDRIAGTEVYRVRKPKTSSIIISILLVFAFFIGSLIFVTLTSVKNDMSYQMAISTIEADQEIVAMVGDIKGYGLRSGSIQHSGNHGWANYIIKVKGSQNTAYVHIQMEKKPGADWEILYYDYRK